MKKVTHAITETIRLDSTKDTIRALDLLIAKDGVFRTSEKWVHDSLRLLIKEGYVNQDGTCLSIGENFEEFLLHVISENTNFTPTLVSYRSLIQKKLNEYDVAESEVMQHLNSITSTDEKLIYLTSVVSDTFGKLGIALEKTHALEAKLAEMDLSLSVMESITFDEDSDK
tara:strand:+ start:20801 stop:21310 length:510 start_codon:yes stop_codon:yes gene_type:complete